MCYTTNVTLNKHERCTVGNIRYSIRGLIFYVPMTLGLSRFTYALYVLHTVIVFLLWVELQASYSTAVVKFEINGILWHNIKFYGVSTTSLYLSTFLLLTQVARYYTLLTVYELRQFSIKWNTSVPFSLKKILRKLLL